MRFLEGDLVLGIDCGRSTFEHHSLRAGPSGPFRLLPFYISRRPCFVSLMYLIRVVFQLSGSISLSQFLHVS